MFKQQETKKKDEGFVDDKGQPLNDQQVQEKKEEPKNPDDIDLKANFEYNDNHLKDIENGRQEFLKYVKKQNIWKWVCSGSAIGLLLFSFIYLISMQKDNPPLKITGYCLLGVSIAIILVYYLINRKITNKRMNAYLKRYYADTNAYVFGQENFSDVNGNTEGKIANYEFNNCHLYKDVSTVGSRNIVNFKIGGKIDCKMCDCAAQKTTMKRLEPLFIGKYLITPNNYNNDDDIIIYLTGNSRALPPNNVEQLPKVLNTKRMIIYSNNKNYESVVKANVRQNLANLITNNVLVDASIAITKGSTYVGLGYDDCLMVLPLQEKFNPRPVEKFKSDMKIIAEIIIELNK